MKPAPEKRRCSDCNAPNPLITTVRCAACEYARELESKRLQDRKVS